MMLDALTRFEGEITRLGIVLSPDGSPLEREGVLNPASASTRDGALLLYPRAVAEGNVSRIESCRGVRSGDALNFERLGFVLEPDAPYEMRLGRRARGSRSRSRATATSGSGSVCCSSRLRSRRATTKTACSFRSP
jgi:hypothetical protein